MSDEELTALVMLRMASIALPGRKLPAAPLRIVRTRWSQDPFARGVYSYWATGNKPGEAKIVLFRPAWRVETRVFWERARFLVSLTLTL